jgi:hypothetical protein
MSRHTRKTNLNQIAAMIGCTPEQAEDELKHCRLPFERGPYGVHVRLNKFSDRTCFDRPFSWFGRRPLAQVQPLSFRLQM